MAAYESILVAIDIYSDYEAVVHRAMQLAGCGVSADKH